MRKLEAGKKQCPYCGSGIPCDPNPPYCIQPGCLLASRFTVGKAVGRDGSGITYTVYDQRLQTIRSMKEFFPRNCRRRPDRSAEILPGQEKNYELMSGRFLQEARIMSVLSEDKVSGTVNIIDRLNLTGNPCILMEYLNGCTLDEWVTRQGKGLPWPEAVQYIQAVLETLRGMHEHGYLHRNICLSNIFRMRNGSIRITGFGSAEPAAKAKKEPGKLWPSSKRYYSPSEQISNGVQGPWTDIYAVGACLFKAAAGGWPANQNNGESFPSLRALGIDVPENLDRVISRATQPEPRKRYSTAEAMLEALNRVEDSRKKLPG